MKLSKRSGDMLRADASPLDLTLPSAKVRYQRGVFSGHVEEWVDHEDNISRRVPTFTIILSFLTQSGFLCSRPSTAGSQGGNGNEGLLILPGG